MIRLLIIGMFSVLAAAGYAQTAWWELQNPKPQVNSLYDVAMLDATTYIAVGEYGVVTKTTDDGATWSQQTITQNRVPLMNLALSPDKQHAITVSSLGRIYYSADQGVTWEQSTYTDTTVTNEVCFRTELEAFGVGRFGRLIRTTDGGKTWSPFVLENPDMLNGVHFPDSLNGFICASSGIFYTTKDGGQTWKRRTFPFANNLYAIHAANANEVIATGDAGGFFLSNDGGDTWQRHEYKGWGLPFVEAFRLNSQKAFVCGNRYAFCSTLNGGATWEPVHGGIIKSVNLYGIAFAGGQQGICVGEDGVIFRTTNGGDSWYRIYFNIAEEEVLRGVHCFDSTTAVAVGSTIVRTSDRGSTWARVQLATFQTLNAVDFPTPEIGYAVGDWGAVMKTTDAGLTWKRLQVPFPYTILRAVSFLNKDTGIAVGPTDNGTIVQTWDGGITWKVGKGPFPMWLLGAAYLSPSTIVLTGFENINPQGLERGLCLRSTDGGWHWDTIMHNIPVGQTISFANERIGYIGGTVGIARTTDAGLTWKRCATNASVRGISAPDTLRATAVGGGSVHTTDGGLTWESVPTVGGGTVYAVHHPHAQSATAVGARALIIRMTTTDPPLDVRTYTASSASGLISAVYPNPAHDRIAVDVRPEHHEELMLRLYSVDGKFIRDLYNGNPGEQTTIECDLSGLRSGSYVLSASTYTRNEYHSIVILH